MTQQIKDENGNVIGLRGVGGDGKNISILNNGQVINNSIDNVSTSWGRETKSNGLDVSAKKETERLRTLSYPSAGGNNHYVRFNININEESKLITRTLVQSTPVNNIEQNRISRDLTSGAAAGTYGGVAGIATGASTGLMLKKLLGAKGATVAAITLSLIHI